MRLVLILVALLSLVLGPVTGPGGMVHARDGATLADCGHADDHDHSAHQAATDQDGRAEHCPGEPAACTDMADCRYGHCAAATAPVPAGWPAARRLSEPGAGQDDSTAGTIVPPPMEPPRTAT